MPFCEHGTELDIWNCDRCRAEVEATKQQVELERKGAERLMSSVVRVGEVLRYLKQDKYMTKKELAEYLNLNIRQINKQLPLIPHFSIGKKKVLFKRSEVDSWMESKRVSKGFMGPPLDADGEINLDAILYKAMYEVQGPVAAAEWWTRTKRRKEAKVRKAAEKAKQVKEK